MLLTTMTMGGKYPLPDTSPIELYLVGAPRGVRVGTIAVPNQGPARLFTADPIYTQGHPSLSIDLRNHPDIERIAVIIEHPILTDALHLRVEGSGAAFDFSIPPTQGQQATIACVLYRHQGRWKIHANGQGFLNGLTGIADHYSLPPFRLQDRTPPPPVTPPAAAPTAPPASISLRKQESISLTKPSQGFSGIDITLSWTASGHHSIDLDLGAFVEMTNGRKHVIQALGNAFGDYDRAPFVRLPHDDRHGGKTEMLQVNGAQWAAIKRIQVYAFIYDGVRRWSDANGVVRIRTADQPEIVVPLTAAETRHGTCAIAEISNQDGNLRILRQEDYYSSQGTMDKALRGWGFSWSPGRK